MKLFTANEQPRPRFHVRGHFPPLSDTEWHNLDSTVSMGEIRSAVFDMGASKAPGVDGLNAGFFQNNWDIVGESVTRFFQRVFATKVVPEFINRTLLVLLPKVAMPVSMAQFRPISLCPVCYKIISKILVNRLKPFLPTWVSDNQTSFVPGRLINDNIVIAHEIIHSMRRKSGKRGWMALKIDLEKAYDRVEWSFIDDTLAE
ncbi:hypothetical protein GQ457_08G036540 [Hibiscus cannabinus]